MSTIASKKKTLINHIMWKMRNNTAQERQDVMRYIKKLSWANLQAYAIRNDFID